MNLQPRSHCDASWDENHKKLLTAITSQSSGSPSQLTHGLAFFIMGSRTGSVCGSNSSFASVLILCLQVYPTRGWLDLHATTVPYITSNPVFSPLNGSWNAPLYRPFKLPYFRSMYLSLSWSKNLVILLYWFWYIF